MAGTAARVSVAWSGKGGRPEPEPPDRPLAHYDSAEDSGARYCQRVSRRWCYAPVFRQEKVIGGAEHNRAIGERGLVFREKVGLLQGLAVDRNLAPAELDPVARQPEYPPNRFIALVPGHPHGPQADHQAVGSFLTLGGIGHLPCIDSQIESLRLFETVDNPIHVQHELGRRARLL